MKALKWSKHLDLRAQIKHFKTGLEALSAETVRALARNLLGGWRKFEHVLGIER